MASKSRERQLHEALAPRMAQRGYSFVPGRHRFEKEVGGNITASIDLRMVIDPLLIQPFCGVGDLRVERLVTRLNAATEPPSAADLRSWWANRTIQQVWWQLWETPTAQRTIMGELPFMFDRHGAHAALANFEHWLDKLAEPWIAARSAPADLLACMEQQVRGDQRGDADHLIVMHYMNGNIVRARELAIEFQLVPDEGYGSPAWERYEFVGMDMLKDERAAMWIGPNMQSSCSRKVRSRRVRFPVFGHRVSAQLDPELMLILKRDRSRGARTGKRKQSHRSAPVGFYQQRPTSRSWENITRRNHRAQSSDGDQRSEMSDPMALLSAGR